MDSSLDECRELTAATRDEVRSACIAFYLFIYIFFSAAFELYDKVHIPLGYFVGGPITWRLAGVCC